MFEKWYLVQISRNIEGGEAKEITQYDDEKSLMSQFYYKLDKVGTNPSTEKLELIIIEPSGNIKRIEQIDTTKYVVAPIESTEEVAE